LATQAQGQMFLVEVGQGLACGQVGGFLETFDAALVAAFQFLFEQFGQEFFEWPVFAPSSGQQIANDLHGGGHAQGAKVLLEIFKL
jgi:hypothetical protein